MLPDITNPEEFPQYDDPNWYGGYDGWKNDERLLFEQKSRLEEIFGLSFEFEGKVMFQDGSLLAMLVCRDACRGQDSSGEYLDLGLMSFWFSACGRLFSVRSATTHPAVTPERIAQAINHFRELGFRFCHQTALDAPYPPEPGMKWSYRLFNDAF